MYGLKKMKRKKNKRMPELNIQAFFFIDSIKQTYFNEATQVSILSSKSAKGMHPVSNT